jgi:hypothetical protein
MKFGFVVDRLDPENSCYVARVIRPNDEFRAMGIDSRILDENAPTAALRECDVLLFHRTRWRIREVAGRGILTGFDLADDLLASRHGTLGVDFLVTDSLPNTRFYLSPSTYYWLHGFPDKTNVRPAPAAETRFVWCGAPENLHTLLGAPLAALEAIARERPLSLRIITNTRAHREKWLGNIPAIEPKNFRVDWLPFSQGTHEALMQECDVGLFPQAIHLDRWRKKSMYKPSHAASLGLPAICSPSEEVCMNFTHGVNAYMPQSAEEWLTAVRDMTDPAQRALIRENVLELFRARFTMRLAAQQMLTIARCELRRNRELRFKGLRRFSLKVYLTVERILNAVQRRLARRAPSSPGKP